MYICKLIRWLCHKENGVIAAEKIDFLIGFNIHYAILVYPTNINIKVYLIDLNFTLSLCICVCVWGRGVKTTYHDYQIHF